MVLGRNVGRHHHQVRHDEHLGDVGEVLDRVVAELVHQVRVDDQRGVAAHRQRVAVGRGLGDLRDREIAAGAGDVLDRHALGPGLVPLVAEQPRGDVRRDARREADQDPDRLVGIARLRDAETAASQRQRKRAARRLSPQLFMCPPRARRVSFPPRTAAKIADFNLPLTIRHTFAAVRQNGRPSLAGTRARFARHIRDQGDSHRGLMTMTKELIERSRQRHAFADVPLIV